MTQSEANKALEFVQAEMEKQRPSEPNQFAPFTIAWHQAEVLADTLTRLSKLEPIIQEQVEARKIAGWPAVEASFTEILRSSLRAQMHGRFGITFDHSEYTSDTSTATVPVEGTHNMEIERFFDPNVEGYYFKVSIVRKPSPPTALRR